MDYYEYIKTVDLSTLGLLEYAIIDGIRNGYHEERDRDFEILKDYASKKGIHLERNEERAGGNADFVIDSDEIEDRIEEIRKYTAYPKDGFTKKQLKGFLHNDSIEEKEMIFDVLSPIIASLRCKSKFETRSERLFFFAYTKVSIQEDVYIREYKLIPQAEIIGSIAKYKPYRADFLNKETKTIVEINGGIHNDRRAYDRERTAKLNELGYTVIVFTNEEIDSDAESCAKEVIDIISRRISKKIR